MSSLPPFEEFPELSREPARLPRHVAIVMDGNGRWARQRGLARSEGHRRGKDSVRAVVDTALEFAIPYLTLFVFSNENWHRPGAEVRFLMQLVHRYLMTETKRLMKRGIRLVAMGDMTRLPAEVRRVLDETIAATAGNRRMTVALALSYGGRQDIVGAIKRIAQEAAAGELPIDQIDEAVLKSHLASAGLPDPDLLIRTSGEQRISNFFLYELAYTELYFTETLWPDFREREFMQALSAYQARERRFDALNGNGTGHRLRAAN